MEVLATSGVILDVTSDKIEPAEYRLYRDERSSSDVDEFWDLGISNDYSYLSLLTLDAILVEIHPCLEKETSHNTA